MIRTIISIVITLALLVGAAVYENLHVQASFALFSEAIVALYDKTEEESATYEDGTAVQALWEEQKRTLHIWIPHSSILEVDYQLYDAVGCLYVKDYKSAIPKLEVLMGMCENIPSSYSLRLENIL